MTMPQTVPVLTAEHLCRKRFNGPDGTHCLRWWIREVFPYAQDRARALAALQDECGVGDFLTVFNDNPRNSKAKIAAAWNRAVDRLGYDVENAR